MQGTDQIKTAVNDFRAALGLLTRFPVHVDVATAKNRGAEIVWAFPLVGALVGGLGGLLTLVLVTLGTGTSFAATLGIALMVLLTGAMHEDGLADTADGLAPLTTRGRRLEIMRDSRIGSFGTIALVLALLARLTGLAAFDGYMLVLVPMAAGAMSRSAMVWVGFRLPQARSDGMSVRMGRPSRAVMILALGIGLFFCLLTTGIFGLVVSAVALAAVYPVARIALRLIGGQTGDILGAAQQCAEIAILGTLIALA